MEQGEGGGSGKTSLEEAKKQWKNPLQVQILEDAYAVTSKPSASMKEDLARKTGLDYKQVQYWFGNRRYLERHGPRKCTTRYDIHEMFGDQRYGGLSLEGGLSFKSISVVYPSDVASLIPSLGDGETSISWRNSRLQKSQEPIELLLSPEMMQPHPFTLSYEEMPQEIERIVKHVEKQLGQPLRTDGPILGVEFSPLPPGAFEVLKEIASNKKVSSECCNGQVIQGSSDETIEDLSFLNKSGCNLVSSSCNGKSVNDGRGHEHCADAFSSPVHQHQNYSPQSSQRSNATHEQQEVVHDNVHSESQTINAQNSANLVTGPRKKVRDGNPCRIKNLQVFPSDSRVVGSVAPHGQTGSPKTSPYWKPRNLVEPGVGTSCLAEGPGENQDFTLTVSSEVKNCCDHNMGNQSTSNRSSGLTSWHADEHFFVRPRKRSRSRSVKMNYFSDHNSATTLVAEWKENEKRAVYCVLDIEINSSDSGGTNSAHNERFKDHATVNVVCSTSGLTSYDNEGSDAGKNLHRNKGMPSSYNIKDNDQEKDKNYKDEGHNNIMTSPVSSEKTI